MQYRFEFWISKINGFSQWFFQVRDSEATSQELHSCAIFISAKSVQVLHDIPIHERQVDINVIIQQYHSILNSLMERENVSLNILSQGKFSR